ncbi:MAG TPA: hypothetical protein VNX86_04800 [Rhizomicrobium sp.]|jgi:hypothetical protein|nr:hypothetical protein [Rhizomicrobium sp.]
MGQLAAAFAAAFPVYFNPTLPALGPAPAVKELCNGLGAAIEGSYALQRCTTDADQVIAPASPVTLVRDTAALTADRKLTLQAGSAFSGMSVELSRNGSAGGFNRNVYQTGGLTLIKDVPDNYGATFVWDDEAALWYVDAYVESSNGHLSQIAYHNNPLAAFACPAVLDLVVLCDSATGALAVDPPAAPMVAGGATQRITIKDRTGQAAAHNVTFAGTVGTSDQSALTIPGQWLVFQWDPTNAEWSQIG